MHSKILVTGGTGLLGSAMKEICPEAVFVGSRDYDLTHLSEAERLFETVRPDAVLHLAAKVGGVRENEKHNADFFTVNVQINTNVLNACAKFRVSRIVSVLSTCAFPVSDQTLNESHLHEGLPFAGHLGYASSKRMLDIHTRLLREQYGIPASTLSSVTLYGPNDNWNPEEGHVLGALIYKCFKAKQEGTPLHVWGNGKAVRQFVFSWDVAKLLLQSLEKDFGPETIIVASDSGISIGELAKAIASAMDFKGPIVFDPGQPEGQKIRRVESKTFRSHFSDFQFTPLQEGLKQTIAWFEEHQSELLGGKVRT